MLKAENIVKTFEKNEKKGKKYLFNAVDGVSLELNQGEIVGILGPNGAGKTTLLRMLGKLMKPSSGKIMITRDGKEIEEDMQIKMSMGYLSNNTRLYERLTTREILQIVGNIYGLSENDMGTRIEELISLLDMGSFIDNRIGKLSTGQTQRASIARCLIHNPDIYIFDEPTLGLDILSSSAIVDFMKKEKEKGKAVLYSTHYMEEAEYLCDRIIMMYEGRIIASGSMAELKELTGKSSLRDIFKELIEKVQVEAK